MKLTIDAMKRIAVNADDARKVAAEFCGEASSEARERLDRLKEICDLGSILDAAQLTVAADMRAGIRHIHAGMQAVAEVHHRGPLSDLFDGALLELGKLQEDADGMYRWLFLLYSRD
ncbi:hypothetical protein [Ralstonia solanacearum]|uniref:Uncharacterized protein n=1 Tax=Ralstonia solanacearum TaxID=305 RepID=A0AAE3T404_RALSL|nr:hypothetical protein [Ralstonia solanacearum]MBB6582222.1 hypothetical protein [Ralstonia solanacearum]MDB0522701.1 hypothetical protein [Ralstonia solanacearum]